MQHILDAIRSLNRFDTLREQIAGGSPVAPLGLNRSARLPVLAALYQAVQRPTVFITQKTDHALTLYDEVHFWAPEIPRYYFPEPTSLFYEAAPWGANTRRERLNTLSTLVANLIPGALPVTAAPLVVVPARALMSVTLPRREFVRAARMVKRGQQVNPLQLAEQWVRAGYEASGTVVVPGQFARRGGILDIWPEASAQPVRLDFFDDEIESLRLFDPASQRSTSELDALLVPPAREYFLPEGAAADGEQYSELHIPVFHPERSNLLDYLPKDALIVFDDHEALLDTIDQFEEQAVGLRADYVADGEVGDDYPLPYLTREGLMERLERFQQLELGPSGLENASDLAHAFRPNQRFGGRVNQVIEHTNRLLERGDQVTIVSRQAARIQDMWQAALHDPDQQAPTFVQGTLNEGWIFTPARQHSVHLLTDGEIFGWKRVQPRQAARLAADAPESAYVEFQPNDLLVHVDHGIGRYKGLVKRAIGDSEQEYLCIEYAAGDQLYVPVHQADRLSRYIGARGQQPTISKLGGVEWRGVKSRVRRAVQQVAEDLLELYARRQLSQGYAFGLDTPWQKELEASFPYVETEDQLRVLEEVKRDMESARPMDRLICGDVGFGKTEIALRAAFKAVMAGRQVAILVPTTVLAQQHYHTFSQRLAAFPARVEMLSRFRTDAQQKTILQDLAKGKIDIIIGTHRLLGSDVVFKDMGLLIIDEEQRFGVTHKEHLKKMRTEVDVLTMTATPIPRTLYMALTGVRDISTINTPPEERLPVITHVGPFSTKTVRQAIVRELERGGQVFFVHNRVQTIESMRAQIEQIAPEARITVAHGQMKETDLAERMRDFAAGEVDVLLSTSIIESGLDIPNANTLIVDRADTFGLAQLYQLRGRVGRGAQRAYAYFFRHKSRRATEEGLMRLDTLAENTHLGAGFSIAMRDLEIRGAGDFLGTRQHGHIAAVGLNLYTRLLSQAVEDVKKQGKITTGKLPISVALFHPLVSVDLPISMTIPEVYVPDKDVRLRLYRRLADVHQIDAVDKLHAEFEDRFGTLPEPVENILYQLRVKIYAEQSNLASVSSDGDRIVIKRPEPVEGVEPDAWPALPPDVRAGTHTLWLPISANWRDELLVVMAALASAQPERA